VVHDQRGRPWVAIRGKGQAVSKMFEGHKYHSGAWVNALRGADKGSASGSEGVWRADNVRAFQHEKCTLYRLDVMVDRVPVFDSGPAPSDGVQVMD
jgi:hypothetical protein